MNTKKISTVVVLVFLILALTFTFTQAKPTSEANSPQSTTSFMGNVFDISQDGSVNDWRPAVAYNSIHHEYMVLWDIPGVGGLLDIWGARVTEDGRVLASFPVAELTNNEANPSIAYDRRNDRYLAVWEYQYSSSPDDDWDIYGRIIPWYGPDPAQTIFSICGWNSVQKEAKVVYAYTQQEYLVVWTNYTVPAYISARRYFGIGGSPNNDGWTITSGTESRGKPDVTYNLARNEYLVTWEMVGASTSFDVWAVRLRGDGIVLGTGEFNVAGWQSAEHIAATAACDKADQYLVAWQSDVDSNFSDYDIYIRYLDGSAIPGNVYPIASETVEHEENVDISCDAPGNKYFLTWQRAGQDDAYWSIRGRMAYPNETFSTIYGVKYYDDLEDRQDPAVAGGTTNFLVVWEHEIQAGTATDIYGRLVGYFLYLPVLVR